MTEEKITTHNQSIGAIAKCLAKRWFIDAFSGMAQGLFVTLIAGTILAMIAGWIGLNTGVGKMLNSIASIAKSMMGVGIGVGIAHALKANKLVVFSASVMGIIGAFSDKIIAGEFVGLTFGAPGNPIGAYVTGLFTVELASLYAGKTKLDIILIPLGMLVLSMLAVYVAWPFIWLINQLGGLIAIATSATPFIMGIVISVIMGILLTMPTSSAAIWVAVASPILTNPLSSVTDVNAILLAGGAAAVGCACHMVGFAVASFRENGVSGLISQGLGTSMLQIPNIMKKPVIMMPMIISSAVLGPISTCLFHLLCGASGGGMGTSGLVGVMGVFEYANGDFMYILGTVLLMIVLPAVLNILISEFMRKKGWIELGDMKLDK